MLWRKPGAVGYIPPGHREEEEMLETVDPTWQMTRWLQLAVQGILDDEVPWYEHIMPLTLGGQGCGPLTSQVPSHHLAVESYGAGVGCLPTHPNCSKHWTVHDVGRGAR